MRIIIFSLLMILSSCTVSLQEIETVGEAKVETAVKARMESK